MEKDVLKQLGVRFKDLQIKKGYTSHETFAYDYGFSRSYYWKVEKGDANLTMNKLLKLLEIHGISLSEFFADFK